MPEPTGSSELIAGEGSTIPAQPAPIQSLVDVGEQGNIKGIKPQVAATAAEYEKTYPLTERKREIKNAGYPPAQVEKFVSQNYKPAKFASLLEKHRGNIVFLEAPSTSRSNTIPLVFANKLANDFGGSVMRGDDYAAAQAKAEAKDKGSYISKMEDPSRFTITDPDLASKLAGKFVVLVDDFVTSGETLDGLTESLTASGIKPQGIVAIGAAKGSKPATNANLKSLATKLSRMLNEPQRRIEEDLQLAHGHSRLNLIRKANDDSTRNPRQVRELIARKAELVRQTLAGREASAQESNNLGPSFATRPGRVSPLPNVVEQKPSQGMGSGVGSLPSQQTPNESSVELQSSPPPPSVSPQAATTNEPWAMSREEFARRQHKLERPLSNKPTKSFDQAVQSLVDAGETPNRALEFMVSSMEGLRKPIVEQALQEGKPWFPLWNYGKRKVVFIPWSQAFQKKTPAGNQPGREYLTVAEPPLLNRREHLDQPLRGILGRIPR